MKAGMITVDTTINFFSLVEQYLSPLASVYPISQLKEFRNPILCGTAKIDGMQQGGDRFENIQANCIQ